MSELLKILLLLPLQMGMRGVVCYHLIYYIYKKYNIDTTIIIEYES